MAHAEAVAPAVGAGAVATATAVVTADDGCGNAVVVSVGADKAGVAVATGVGAAVGIVGMEVGATVAAWAGTALDADELAETSAVAVAGALPLSTLQPASNPATTTNPPIAAVVLLRQEVSTVTQPAPVPLFWSP